MKATPKHLFQTHPYLGYVYSYPFFILGISLYSLLNIFSGGINLPDLVVSILGITGSVLSLRQVKSYRTFLHLWALGQTIIFVVPFINWEVDTIQKITFSFNFTLKGGNRIHLGINLIGFIFMGLNFYLNRLLFVKSLIGKEVNILTISLPKVKELNHLLPAKGIIEHKIKIDSDSNWLMLTLNDFKGKTESDLMVAIRSTDKSMFKPKSGRLIMVRKLKGNYNPDKLKFTKEDFEFLGVAKAV